MLTIYGAPTYNAFKVVMTAEEAGMEYEYVTLNFAEGEQRSPEHMKRHALGKVPAIEHEGRALFESGAICRYLSKVSDSTLYVGDAYGQAIIDQWMDFMSSHVGRWLSSLYFHEFISPKLLQQEGDPAAIEEAKNFLKAQMPAVEKQLGENQYFAGADFTLADIIAFSLFQTHESTSAALDEYPNIGRWYKEIKSRPSVEKANSLVHPSH